MMTPPVQQTTDSPLPVLQALPRCATCKHWGTRVERTGWRGTEITRHVCEMPDARDPRREFSVVQTEGDDHGVEIVLETGPDFGCVLHAPR